ncbi:MAG: hypothetical protein SFW63_08645 [Alphaproteobacteria bacterium]|nr:hypothetical protein [Alphaproteobacteria bacterium]
MLRFIRADLVVNTLISCLSIFCAWYILLDHDVGAFFSYSERIIAGGKLYVDVHEVNTPLVTYLLMPIALLQQHSGIAYTTSFFIIYGLIFFACALFSQHLLSYFETFRRPDSKLISGIAICYILLLSVALDKNFGQREHFFICFIFPYIVTLMARDYGIDLPRNQRLLAGLIAGIGFCIKPNFIIVLICAEIVSLARQKSLISCFRLETLVIGVIFVSYHIWFLVTFPEYLDQLPHFMNAYRSYQSIFLLTLAKMLFALSAFYFYIVLVIKLRSDLSKITSLLAVSAGACFHYLIQNAGFNYHLIPAYAFLIWVGVVLLINSDKSKYALIIIFLSLFPYTLTTYYLADRRELILSMAEKIKLHTAGGSVAILSTSAYPAFPVINYAAASWPLSSAHLRQLPVSYKEFKNISTEPNYRTLDEMSDTERYFTERNLGELEQRPELIVIDERDDKQGLENVQFNILNYFLTQERFRALWKDYRYIGTLHDFAFYKYEPAAKP